MVTKETIEKKVKEHGERLKQITEQARNLRTQDVRIQQGLVQLSDESKVIQGAIKELQDLLKELNESPPENEEVLPPVDDPESGDNAQPEG